MTSGGTREFESRPVARLESAGKRARLLALVRGRGGLLLVARVELAYARGLTAEVAQVVELRAAHAAAAQELYLADDGAVDGEDALDADAEARLPDGERLAYAVALARTHHALERL